MRDPHGVSFREEEPTLSLPELYVAFPVWPGETLRPVWFPQGREIQFPVLSVRAEGCGITLFIGEAGAVGFTRGSPMEGD